MTLAATKSGARKPVDSETATLESLTLTFDDMDVAFGLEPFWVRQGTWNGTVYTDVVWDAPNTRYIVTIGPGAMQWGTALTVLFAAQVVYLAAPAVGTTYYMYAKSDGTYGFTTSAVPVVGQAIIWQINTPNPNATPASGSVIDRRPKLPNTDQGAVLTGDLAGSTLGAPVIAAGAVTLSKMAAASVDNSKFTNEVLLRRSQAAISTGPVA